MGGTTAKICLLSDGEPDRARKFEIARPIATCVVPACRCASRSSRWSRSAPAVDRSPASTSSTGSSSVPTALARCPGPAVMEGWRGADRHRRQCRAGQDRSCPFAGGKIPLDTGAAERALNSHVGKPLRISVPGPPPAWRRSSRRTWPMPPASMPSSAARTSLPAPWWHSAAVRRPCLPAGRQARDQRDRGAERRRRRFGHRLPQGADRL